MSDPDDDAPVQVKSRPRRTKASVDDSSDAVDVVEARKPWQTTISAGFGGFSLLLSALVLGSCLSHRHGENSNRDVVLMGVTAVCIAIAVLFGLFGIDRSRSKAGGPAPAAGAATGLKLGLISLAILAVTFALGVVSVFGSAGGPGRLFRRRGRPRVADAARDEAWASSDEAPRLDVGDLSAAARSALAAAWTRDALIEHASIAAFARLSLELIAHGAPPDLLARTHDAALDEIDHAERSFAIASAYAGHAVGAGAFPAAASRSDVRGDLATIARESIVDGCVGEGFAAACARASARATRTPVLRAFYERIAEDEARHAELAWDVLAFAVERGGVRIADAASRALASAHGPSLDVDAGDLAVHGWIAAAERASLHAAVVAAARERLPSITALVARAA